MVSYAAICTGKHISNKPNLFTDVVEKYKKYNRKEIGRVSL